MVSAPPTSSWPRPGAGIQAGFPGAEDRPVGRQRYGKETRRGLTVGEPVAMDRKLGMEPLRGERCLRCRILVPAS